MDLIEYMRILTLVARAPLRIHSSGYKAQHKCPVWWQTVSAVTG